MRNKKVQFVPLKYIEYGFHIYKRESFFRVQTKIQ